MLHACYVFISYFFSYYYLVLLLIATFSTSTNTVRISQKKCEEYAKLVNNMEVAPTLRFGIQTHSVSQCKIIETPLIIGGVKAKNKEFPHMVAIGFGPETSGNFDDVDVSWECGGSIISEDFILTAAHCLESKYRGPAIRVLAGTTSLNHPDMDYQERDVAERIRHPNYTLPARYNDIGLIRLQESLWLDGAVRPACLQILPSTMESGISSGFGKISFDDDDINEDLMKVQLNYISREECEKSYKYDLGGKMLPSGLIPSILCAGVMEGGKDTCQGDSGGPLQEILAEPYCMYSIVGITSFGKFCGFENSPGIYTRVSSYLDWIESVVWPDQD